MKNTNQISPQIIDAIRIITENVPTAVIGGSIALLATGLIDRKVGDIDVFIPDVSISGLGVTSILFRDRDKSFKGSDTVIDMYGKRIQRMACVVNGINVCVFKVDARMLQHSEFYVCGIKVKIQNVNYAIAAKVALQDKDIKHKIDLAAVYETLNHCFPPVQEQFYATAPPVPQPPVNNPDSVTFTSTVDTDDLPLF